MTKVLPIVSLLTATVLMWGPSSFAQQACSSLFSSEAEKPLLLFAPPERKMMSLSELAAFDPAKEFETLTLTLRAELGLIEINSENTSIKPLLGQAKIEKEVIPLANLAVDTSQQQVKRLQQIEDKLKQLEALIKESSITKVIGDSRKIADFFKNYRSHLRETKVDMIFTGSTLEELLPHIQNNNSHKAKGDQLSQNFKNFQHKAQQSFERSEALLSEFKRLTLDIEIETINPIVLKKTLEPHEAQELIRAIPKHEMDSPADLKDLSYYLGERLGLKDIEVDEAFDVLTQSGALGGFLHVYTLVNSGQSYSAAIPHMTKMDLRNRFSKYSNPEASNETLNEKSRLMTKAAMELTRNGGYDLEKKMLVNLTPSNHDALRKLSTVLSDPRKAALLQLWYRGTLRSSMNLTLRSAPGEILEMVRKAGAPAGAMATLASMYGVMLGFGHTMEAAAAGHGGIAALEYVATLAGIPTSVGVLFGSAKILDKFDLYRYGKLAKVIRKNQTVTRQFLTTKVLVDKGLIQIPKLKPFDINQTYESYAFPLRMEVLRLESNGHLVLGDYGKKFEDITDERVPLAKLAIETSSVQLKHLNQMEAQMREFKNYLKGLDAKASGQSAIKKLKDIFLNYNLHLRRAKEDLDYSVSVLEEQVLAIKQAEQKAVDTRAKPALLEDLRASRATMELQLNQLHQTSKASYDLVKSELVNLERKNLGFELDPFDLDGL